MRNEGFMIPMCNDGAVGTIPLLPNVIRESANGESPLPLEAVSFAEGDLYLTGGIDDLVAERFGMALRLAARERKNLRIFVNSPGGSVSAGLAMYDAMREYPYDVDICCTGLAASMAAVLLAGGRKGHRYILPHSKVMIHEPLIAGGLGGSATSIQRTADSIIETKKILNGLLSEFTGRTVEEIDRNTAFDNFFNADEAIEFGLCDKLATGYENITEV